MDDMNVFERLVAGEVMRAAEPVRPVDDAALFEAVRAADQSPMSRLRSMFGATKFVVAAGVVTLFGGFLLAGVVIQPIGEIAPPGATATAAPVDPLRDDATLQLPAYLAAEEIERGVLKVMHHEVAGTDHGEDLVGRAFVGVALAADGTPWVLEAETGYGDPGRFSLLRLGTDERHELADPGNVTADLHAIRSDLAMADDGSVWARWLGDGSVLYSFDGSAWTTVEAPHHLAGFTLDTDGEIWIEREVVTGAPHESVHGLVDGRWQSLPPVDEQTLSELAHPWEFDGRTPWMGVATVGPNGDAWVPAPGGLLRHGPDGWSFHAPIPLAEPAATVLVAGRSAIGPDGTVWYFANEGRREVPKLSIAHHLARLDGSGWTVYSDEDAQWDFEPGGGLPMLDPWTGLTVDDAGRLWIYGHLYTVDGAEECGGVLSFDGRDWQQHVRGACVNDVAVGADGSVWAASHGTFERRDDQEMAGIFIIDHETGEGAA